jgi:hypothetical protein
MAKLSVLIQPVPPIPCLYKGFRCGLWHPPTAHKLLLVMLLVLISSPIPNLLFRQPLPDV